MEPRELSPALLQPQVTVVAILGELLATLRGLDMMLPAVRLSLRCLFWDLEEFTEELRDSLCCVSDTWRRHTVPSDDDESPTSYDNDSVTSLSRALAASKSAPWIPQNRVTMAARKWQGLVAVLVNRWAQLAMAATKLPNAWRDLATKADDRVATATARARELQDKAASDGTAQENMEELGQLLGREEGDEVVSEDESSSEDASSPSLGEEVVEVAKASTGAMIVRQRVETALGLLERLVAACDEATAFPRELQRLLRDIEAALKGTTEASPKVPEDLVAKVAVAEQLWEANTRLVKDHLGETLKDIIRFYFTGAPASPSACGVAERCQRAIEDIPRLVQPPECPQSVLKVSPVSMEPQELSPAPLQTQVTVVAILGELLATLPSWDEMLQLMSPRCLYWDLLDFTKELRATLHRSDDTWRHHDVTSNGDDTLASLSRALATYKSIPGTTRNRVTMAASEWQGSVAALVNSWARLARKATKLRYTWREVAAKVNTKAATATARARELQDKAARDGTAQKQRVELGLPLFWVERPKVVTGPEARVKRAARVAASEATRATMVRQRVEAALGLPERLVATCHKATAFPRELQRRVGDIEAALKGTNEASCDVPEALVAKVAVAERLWEANTRLAKDHLRGTVHDISLFLFTGGAASLSAREVAERCQRATEDIPRLVRPLDGPQGVPKVSPVSMEPQELSPALLQPQVTVVATLGELLATLPSQDEMNLLLEPPRDFYWQLESFTKELRDTRYCIEDPWWQCSVTRDDDDPVTSLSQALAAWESTPGTSRKCVTMAASKWLGWVDALMNRWALLARAATELRDTCRDLATKVADMAVTATTQARELQAEAARDGTAQGNMVELGQALGREEGAEVVAGREAQVRRDARVAAREATMATMVRQRVEAALGLLERLVATCDEATAFPRELQRLLRDIKAALKGTNEASPNIPHDLVAKVAVAKPLWEANAHLVKDHLWGTLKGIIKFYFDGDPDGLSAREVIKRCQRATEEITRLLPPPESPQIVPSVSPVSMELQEPSLSQLLEALVSMVATLGEVAATVTGPHRGVRRCVPPKSLHAALRNFTWSLRETLGHPGVPSLGQALATLRATPGATWADVRAAASAWRELVAAREERWDQLKEEATKLRDACEDAAPARAGDLQDKATHRGTAGDSLVATAQQLPVALDRDEEASAEATRSSQMAVATNEAVGEAVVATKRARVAIRRRHWAEVALGPLQRLVAACDGATEFISYTECQLRDIEAALEGTKEVSTDVPEALVAKVAKAEQLWEASARLFNHHLEGTLRDIHDLLLSPYGGHGGPDGPGSRTVAERCQRAIEDIPRLLQDSDVTAVTSSRQ